MGTLGSENVQGEVQKALDVITNDIFIEACQKSGYVAGMASEELVDVIDVIDEHKKNGNYLLLFDPLDGSSNVNVNISVGTIFSILKSSNNKPDLADYLQLDVKSNEFLLTHPNMQIAKETQEFAINMSNYRFWREPVQRYIDECLQGEEGDRKKDFNMRWVASMVAEVHRILVRGGVFMYPTDAKSRSGKLRLMYEANPMSFIVEQAGGASTTGSQRILEIQPSGIHQRVPVMMGCRSEVERIVSYHQATFKRK
jgi:fructose-1,6-bisphosphatase I